MSKKFIKKILFFLLLLLSCKVEATHLRAANIFVDRVEGSNTRFVLTLVVYSDDDTDFYNGNSTGVTIESQQEIYLNNNPVPFVVNKVGVHQTLGVAPDKTNKTTFRGEITVPSPNGRYRFKWQGVYRNNGILNLGGDNQFLFVESYILLNGGGLKNSTPDMLIDPIDKGFVNSVFQYNSGAYDVDGDSLSYELIPVQSGDNNNNGALIGFDIPGQVSAASPTIGAGGTIDIDPVNGTVTWNAPRVSGEYNIAIKINEWRNGVRIGYVIRDMQIIIEDNDLEPPIIKIPNDTCVVAGTILNAEVIANNDPSDRLSLSLLGEIKSLGATLNNQVSNPGEIIGQFAWSPSCSNPREQPYFAIFKATTNPDASNSLSAYEEWSIQVIGEQIKGVTASYQPSSKQNVLQWSPYCVGNDDVTSIEIWRRSCDTLSVSRAYCDMGIPLSWGFQEIGEVSASEVQFIDDNVFEGNKYYYVLTANIAGTNGGQSVASEIVEVDVAIQGPWISRVSVIKQDSSKGVVQVDFKYSNAFTGTGPFTLELLRSDSLDGENYVEIKSVVMTAANDTVFIDSSLNTYQGRYSYAVRVNENTNDFYSETQFVSVLVLQAEAEETDIDLFWSANAPLFTPDSLFNEVFRDYDQYPLYDSINGELYSYKDVFLESDSLYCYYVSKPVAFCNGEFNEIINVASTAACDLTFDFTAPCPPFLSVDPLICQAFDPTSPTQNQLQWEWDISNCQVERLNYYELVYSANSNEEFVSIYKGLDTSFLHKLNDTYVGCYKIRAEDRSGNLGVFSNTVCKDNCPFIEFPNVFTPNLDGANDVFEPMPIPQFVEGINVIIINRWGDKVFEGTSRDLKLWDGKDPEGNFVSPGVYYYFADVKFKLYDQNNNISSFKGWLQVLY